MEKKQDCNKNNHQESTTKVQDPIVTKKIYSFDSITTICSSNHPNYWDSLTSTETDLESSKILPLVLDFIKDDY